MEEKKYYEEDDFKEGYGELRYNVTIKIENISKKQTKERSFVIEKNKLTLEELKKFIKSIPQDPLEYEIYRCNLLGVSHKW